MTDTVEKSVTVPLSTASAFALFFQEMHKWWPSLSHSVTGPSGTKPKIIVEAHKGGRIIEVAADGTRHIWGTIIGWDNGHFAAFTWHPGADEDDATVVSVSFTQTGDGCRVDVTHGAETILGPHADAISTTFLNSWGFVLGCYCGGLSRAKVLA